MQIGCDDWVPALVQRSAGDWHMVYVQHVASSSPAGEMVPCERWMMRWMVGWLLVVID
jgi:hypothetical protein